METRGGGKRADCGAWDTQSLQALQFAFSDAEWGKEVLESYLAQSTEMDMGVWKVLPEGEGIKGVFYLSVPMKIDAGSGIEMSIVPHAVLIVRQDGATHFQQWNHAWSRSWALQFGELPRSHMSLASQHERGFERIDFQVLPEKTLPPAGVFVLIVRVRSLIQGRGDSLDHLLAFSAPFRVADAELANRVVEAAVQVGLAGRKLDQKFTADLLWSEALPQVELPVYLDEADKARRIGSVMPQGATAVLTWGGCTADGSCLEVLASDAMDHLVVRVVASRY